MLNLQYLIAGSPDAEVVAGPGRGDAGYRDSGVDIHVTAIVVPDDLDGRISFVAKIFGAPLTQAAAGRGTAVAVGGENRLTDTGPGEIVGKNGVDKPVNVGINISSPDPFLVVGGGGGDREVVALVPIPRKQY